MAIPEPTAEQLYDLSLLGLSWLREYMPDEQARYGSTVMNVLSRANTFPYGARARVDTNVGLITVTMRNMYKLSGRRPQKRQLDHLIADRSEHLLVHVPREPFSMPGLFGRFGYGLIITEAGIQYASEKVETYATHVTFDQFMVAWRENTRQLSAINAGRRPQKAYEPVDG